MDAGKPVGPGLPAAPAAAAGPLALYVHIPFCETKCPYCDFNTYAGIETLIPGYVAALCTEIEAWGRLLGRPDIATVFFGGGTPSYVPAADMARLMRTVQEAFGVLPGAEVTIESNPGDLDSARLATYLDCGINRISIGVQSFDDALLDMLGRRHDAPQAAAAYEMARSAGFRNINIDLMFGLPEQTQDQWRASLERCLELGSEHISLYALTIEANTPMEVMVNSGRLPEPDPDLAADMYLAACDALEGARYAHYEISNWSKPGLEAQHNLAYWLSRPYLGVGPGAHSYIGGGRFENLRSPRSYVNTLKRLSRLESENLTGDAIDLMQEAGPVSEIEEASVSREISDALMMGLRLRPGISSELFEKRFGKSLRECRGDVIDELATMGLLIEDEAGIRIPHDRWLLGNEVFMRFIGDSISARVRAPASTSGGP